MCYSIELYYFMKQYQQFQNNISYLSVSDLCNEMTLKIGNPETGLFNQVIYWSKLVLEHISSREHLMCNFNLLDMVATKHNNIHSILINFSVDQVVN